MYKDSLRRLSGINVQVMLHADDVCSIMFELRTKFLQMKDCMIHILHINDKKKQVEKSASSLMLKLNQNFTFLLTNAVHNLILLICAMLSVVQHLFSIKSLFLPLLFKMVFNYY